MKEPHSPGSVSVRPLSPLLRFGRDEVFLSLLWPQVCKTPFFAAFYIVYVFFLFIFLFDFYSENGAILKYDPHFLGLFHNESH